MDRETKTLLGRILGELLVLKARVPGSRYTPDLGQVFGLLHGFETTIDTEIGRTGFISEAKEKAVCEVLEQYFRDPEQLAAFTGYYQIEHELGARGVYRSDAMMIFKKLLAENSFVDVIDKIQKGRSPTELHNLDVKLDEL